MTEHGMRTWRVSVARVVIGAGTAGLLLGSTCQPQPGVQTGPGGGPTGEKPLQLTDVWPPRAVWVVRRAFDSRDAIADLMEQVRQAGLNTVLWQVRGNGTVFYRSAIEPLADEYRRGEPGFDPLRVACEEAHRRGLALHAWVNVMPAWRGKQPPSDPEQLYHTHPEWFWYDQHNRRQPLDDFYVSLNPCLPEVRRYLVDLFREIVEGYPVQGLHLDYIRFPIEESPKGSDYPRDAQTLALYRRASGRTPEQDAEGWSRWRRAQVTQLVRDIRAMMKQARPGAKLTAACAPDIAGARRRYFQDGSGWLHAGLLDLVFVMNYSADTKTYRLRQEAWRQAAGGRSVAPGIGVYMHKSNDVTLEQLRLAREWGHGFALFSDRALFGRSSSAGERLRAIQPLLSGMKADAARRHDAAASPVSVGMGASLSAGGATARPGRPARALVP